MTIFIVASFLTVDVTQAQIREDYPNYSWYIDDFGVDMKVMRDGSLEIRELIEVDFSETSKRGIIREIPYKYDVDGKLFDRVIGIDILSVKNEIGETWKYEVNSSGGYKRVRIGDPVVYWSEPLVYDMEYKVENVLNNFDKSDLPDDFLTDIEAENWDEIYWNMIGSEWGESPIDDYNLRIDLSEFSENEVLSYECFIGELGGTQRCDLVEENYGLSLVGDELGYMNGVTVGLAFVEGVIEESFSWNKFVLYWEYLIWFLPLLVLVGFWRHWYKYGRDLPKRSIIPRYELDEDMRAMEVGTLVDEKFNNEDLTAGIIDLSVRGFLRVEELKSEGLFGGKDFKFVKLKDYKNAGLLDFEERLMKGLFANRKSVKMSDLQGSFYTTVNSVRRKVFQYLVDEGYYKKNPMNVRSQYLGIGSFFVFGSIWLTVATQFLWIMFIALPFGLGAFMVAPFMSKKTEKGMRTYEKVLGFKEFIKVAEKDRVKFFQEFNDVKSKKDEERIFESLLPYAMAYGMGEEWSDIFKELFETGYNPTWYSGRNGSFDSNSFNRSLSGISRGMAAAGVAPSSSGSSGGSFSGGGFSGGGFGGGGGSSW